MKNILFVHSSSELYGSDRSLLNTIKYIDKNKFNVYVLLPSEGPLVNEIKKIIEHNHIFIHSIAVLRRKNFSIRGFVDYSKDFFWSYRFIKAKIKSQKIDIVDTNTAVVFPGAIAAKVLHIKSVWHIREIIESKFENIIISKIVNHFSNIVIANSDNTGKSIDIPNDKIKVIYNAVEESTIKKVSHKQIIVGMAGRLNRWKGQSLFIDAARKVIYKHPDAIFQIAGETYAGEEKIRISLENKIEKYGLSNNIQLLGQVNDMDNFYSNIDIFVLPSIQPEPFGLVVIEAMDHSLPVVATDHGGPVEIVVNGLTGYLVDYKKSSDMANKINFLIENPQIRYDMGKKGLQIKREHFSVNAMVDSLSKIYETI